METKELSKKDVLEIEKCKQSIAYFYNKYIKKSHEFEITDNYINSLKTYLDYWKRHKH